MLGLGRKESRDIVRASEDTDLAKLFFDVFSKRLSAAEEGLKSLSREAEKLAMARDQSQISDLVLLERVQKVEQLLHESLTWIKKVADTTYLKQRSKPIAEETAEPLQPAHRQAEVTAPPVARLILPSGEASSLPSIATPTELQVLTLLAERGPLSAPEIGKVVGRSREHSARLMRKLFDEGYVRRDQTRIPFRYSLVERVRQGFKKAETTPGAEETVTVPQT